MKVKVFSASRWICLFYLALDIVAWTFVIVYNGLSFFQESFLVWGTMLLFLAIMPLGLLVWNILTMENVIVFDERGISRKRFGKTIRHFDWEEIQTISATSDDSFSGWLYISNESRSFNYTILSITKMRIDKKVIYLHVSEKAKTAFLTYAPEYLKEKVEKLK